MKAYLGCSGWSYDSWVGSFYPEGTKNSDFLRLYSRVFNAVEIDSTFYRLPTKEMVYNWAKSTPDDFVFTVKMPKQITHESNFSEYEATLEHFLSSMKILSGKLHCILIQLAPSYSYANGWKKLNSFLEALPSGFSYAVEFRHADWFREEVYSRLKDIGIIMVWSEIPYVHTPAVLTTSAVYLRLVGDRSIKEEQFGKIIRNRGKVIKEWAAKIKNTDAERVFAFSNNHFQGFAPETVNLLSKELGLDSVNWVNVMSSYREKGQRTLFD